MFKRTQSGKDRGETREQVIAALAEATQLIGVGQYDEALAMLTHSLPLIEEDYGSDHPNLAVTLSTIAVAHWMKGDHEKATSHYERALKILETKLGSEDPRLTEVLEAGGRFYHQFGEHGRAETLLTQAVTLYEATLSRDDPAVAEAQTLLADVYITQSRYRDAQRLLLRARRILQGSRGDDRRLLVDVLSSLARVCEREGDYDIGESLLRRSLEIQKGLGAEADQADLLTRLAVLLQDKGDFVEAEGLLVSARNALKEKYGDGSIHLVDTLYTLGRLYALRKEYNLAEPLFWETLSITQKHYGKHHPNTALHYNAIGALYFEEGNLDLAENGFRQALELWEGIYGPQGSKVAAALENLGMVFEERGDDAQAEEFYDRATTLYMDIRRDHPAVGRLAYRLGLLAKKKGDAKDALRHFIAGLTAQETSLGYDHPSIALILHQLAMVHAHQGNIGEAVSYLTRANDIIDQHLAESLVEGLNTEPSAFLRQFLGSTNKTLALHLRSALNNPEAAHLAFRTLLRRKGRLLDANVDNSRWVRNSDDPEVTELAGIHELYGAMRVEAFLQGPAYAQEWMEVLEFEEDQFDKYVEFLGQEIQDIERELALKAATQRGSLEPITIETIRERIPSYAVLIEFVKFFPVEPMDTGPLPPARFGAYVLHTDGTLAWADLGNAAKMEEAIDAFRIAVQSPARTDWKEHARILDQRIMDPLWPLLGESQHLLLSPDGALTMIPFEVLVDSTGRHLVERCQVTYLTSGRDLLRPGYDDDEHRSPFVLAGPDFDAVLDVDEPIADQETGQVPTSQSTEFTRLLPLTALAGAEAEGRILQSILPQAVVLTGADASKAQLLSSHGPLVLHLATHGFFLEGRQLSDLAANLEAEPTLREGRHLRLPFEREKRMQRPFWDPNIKNPLLRSGLALAGVNRVQSGSRGVMTALEVSGLDLWGTQLVVLSACDTGLGAVVFGEGVYGLRRAFLLAGAETVVMSLWKVADAAARDFMEGFYRRIRDGKGRSEALQEVQLEMLRGDIYSHPYYWAAFILTGEWAPVTSLQRQGDS